MPPSVPKMAAIKNSLPALKLGDVKNIAMRGRKMGLSFYKLMGWLPRSVSQNERVKAKRSLFSLTSAYESEYLYVKYLPSNGKFQNNLAWEPPVK